MDISLNITSNTSNSNINKINNKETKKSPQFKKNRKTAQNDFAFSFTKNAKIKAVVAKRRKPLNKATVSTPSSTFSVTSSSSKLLNQNNNNEKSIIENNETKTKKHIVKLNKIQKLQTITDKKKNKEKLSLTTPTTPEKIPDDNDLSSICLNVTGGNELDYIRATEKTKKQKCSRKKRKEINVEKRAIEYQLFLQNKKMNKTTGDTAAAVIVDNTKTDVQTKPSKIIKPSVINSKQPIDRQFKKALMNNEMPVVGQKFVKPIDEQVFTGAAMETLNIHAHCIKNMADLLNITELTTVQQRTVPIALAGHDILVRSQTGSGKTLAYALPIVQKLQEITPKLTRTSGIQALIIVSTRELAIQCYELFVKLLKPYSWLVSTYITGGEKRKSEKARLRKGVNILIGTPGRLCDHLLHTESFKLDKVKWLILDEADRLFDLGYEIDVKRIVDVLNNQSNADNKLQSMLLSATLTASVKQLAGLTLKTPIFIDTSDTNDKHKLKINTMKTSTTTTTTTNNNEDDAHPNKEINNDNEINEIDDEKFIVPSTITQNYIIIPPKLRLVTLSGLIANEAAKNSKKILIFFGTEHLVNYHYDLLVEGLTKHVLDDEDEEFNKNYSKNILENDADDDDDDDLEDYDDYVETNKKNKRNDGLSFTVDTRFFKLHGNLSQYERVSSYKAFREAKTGVFLTTDVACRGIDVPMVDLVVQFSPPQTISDYVHRVGRTARAGRTGQGILFLSPNEIEFIRMLEDKRIRISQLDSKIYLKAIVDNNQKTNIINNNNNNTNNLEETIAKLQHKFEELVTDDRELYNKGCLAFVSWLRFVAAYPKEFRNIFNVKNTHMGHYAKSLALREPPSAFVKSHTAPKPVAAINRLTYTDDTQRREQVSIGKKRQHTTGKNLNFKKFNTTTISEFDSGLPPMKKRKQK